MPAQTRRLAAILFADIAGYTALMQKDEGQAKTSLTKFREVLQEQVAAHSGQIVHFYGDGCLAIFNTPTDASACAAAIQWQFQQEPVIPVRVGLHTGTVNVEEDHVFGDAINLTSRIESLGIAGSILLSKKIRDELKNQPDFLMVSLGTFNFKNVEEPMEVFALANEGLLVPKQNQLGGQLKEKAKTGMKKTWWLVIPLLFVLFGIWYFLSSKSNPSPLNEDGFSRYLIMPFEVQGGADVQYLGKGMVDLLSANLDGIGYIRTIDPNIVLSTVQDGDDIRDPQYALKAFSDLEPNRVLLGSITRLGSQYRFNATLYDNLGKPVSRAEAKTEDEAELPTVIDQLSQQLLAKELAAEGLENESLAAMSTTNTAALKSYLAGEAFRRKSQFDEANKAFARAVENDSTLALAWYRLYDIYGWYRGKYSLEHLYRKTESLFHRLPDKFQSAFQLYKALQSLDGEAVERIYANGVRQFGADIDHLMLYGEYLYHTSIRSLGDKTDAKPYFQKVVDYRPDNTPAILHLIDIAYYEKDTLTVDTLVNRISNASPYYPGVQIQKWIITGHDIGRQEIEELGNLNSFSYLAYPSSTSSDNIAILDTLFERLLEAGESIDDQTSGRIRLFKDVSRGRRIPSEYPPVFAARLLGDPVLNPGKEAYEALKLRIPEEAQNTDALRALWMLNIYHAFLGDEQAYREIDQKMKAQYDGEHGGIARWFHLYCEVIRWRNRGENEKALSNIDSLLQQKTSPGMKLLYDENAAPIHLIKGQILFEKGAYEEAYQWFYSIRDFYGVAFFIGPATLRMAQCQEKLGNKREALQNYNYFIELFQGCAPLYQPWLQEAKAAREQLMSELG